jgi:hypothetical protein
MTWLPNTDISENEKSLIQKSYGERNVENDDSEMAGTFKKGIHTNDM